MQLQPRRKGPTGILTENSFLSLHSDIAGEGMESDSDSNGFEDEVIGNVSNTVGFGSGSDGIEDHIQRKRSLEIEPSRIAKDKYFANCR